MNRIEEAVAKREALMARIAAGDFESNRKLTAKLTKMADRPPLADLAQYQEWKSLAQANGTISLEEALSIYACLNDWDAQTVGRRLVVLQALGEIACALRIGVGGVKGPRRQPR